jgi:exosortase/archaeosortase family protein
MKNKDKKIIFIVIRYLVLLVLALSLAFFYKILTPLTIYSTAGLLKILYQVSVSGDIISVSNIFIQIIPACVAGSAYLLLLILNLLTSMRLKQRIYSILFSIVLLFVLNVLRIFFLTILLVNDFKFFDFTHKLFWYVLSTIFVVGIWFLTIKLFKIKKIPAYSDMKFLIKEIKRGKK